MKRLPPLSALEAFVHAARTGSVKAAAEALALSSPALTRLIQALERPDTCILVGVFSVLDGEYPFQPSESSQALRAYLAAKSL